MNRETLEAALLTGLTTLTSDEGPVRVAVMSSDGGVSLNQEAGLAALLADAVLALSSPETTPAPDAGLDVEAPEGYTPWVGLMEEAARALGASRSKNKHGQLCPVWARRTVNRGLAPTIEQCDCWILRDARFDAAIVLRAALSQ